MSAWGALLKEPICRTRRWEGTVGLVEDLHCAEDGSELRSFSPDFQVCPPYRGLFVWHVGDDDSVANANQILFVSGGEPYQVTQPVPTDYAELIVTPDPELLGVSDACVWSAGHSGSSRTSRVSLIRASRVKPSNVMSMWPTCSQVNGLPSMITRGKRTSRRILAYND